MAYIINYTVDIINGTDLNGDGTPDFQFSDGTLATNLHLFGNEYQNLNRAMSEWEKVANVNFHYNQNPGANYTGWTVMLGKLPLGVFGSTQSSSGAYSGGVVVVDETQVGVTSLAYGVGFKTLMHELGHTFGDSNYFGINHPAGPNTQSIMSSTVTPPYTLTPSILDIQAAQALFGATVHNAGNTVYHLDGASIVGGSDSWHAGAGETIVTIWDSGGKDTISLFGYSGASGGIVDLREGLSGTTERYSKIGDTRLYIAYNALIENAEGSVNNDTLTGNDTGNELHGFNGDDSLTGGKGNDTLFGGLGKNTLDGGDDQDAADYSGMASAISLILGAANPNGDTLLNIEKIIGTDVDDKDTFKIAALASATTLDGGAGTKDLLDLSMLGVAAVVNMPGQSLVVNGQFHNIKNFEHLIGTSYNDFLIGNGSNNTLEGGDGDDRLSGNGGSDQLIGGVGNDTLEGGDGDDRFTVQLGLGSQAGGDGFDVFDGGAGTDTVDYSQSDVGLYIHMVNGLNNSADTLISIENLILTQFDDTAFGNDSDNILSGLQGNDSLLGGGFGNDTLLGGAGSDTIKGGWNNDLLEGGDGADVLYANGYSKGQTGEDRIYGGKDNDILHAGGGNSPRALYGGDGDDEIFFVPPLTSGGSSLPLITDATVYGGSGMDTIHSNFLKNSMTIADSDGNFTLDFIDATITGMGFDPNGGNPIFVFFADDSDPHADSYLYYSDGSFGEPVGYYFGPLLILAEGENSRPSVWPYDIFIDNIAPYLTENDVSLVNGNIVIHATPQDPNWGAENTSGFVFV